MGEVLKQMENRGVSFFIIWILPLLAMIGLIAIVYWLRELFKETQIKMAGEYQPQNSGIRAEMIMSASISSILGRAGGLKYELNTNNNKDFLLEAKVPIQAARFTKPRDIVVRPEHLPIMIECENSFWKRMRNKILSVPAPRIIVKRFTEKGLIWDEENTTGTDITIEFYPK